jgi:hypothetical protein
MPSVVCTGATDRFRHPVTRRGMTGSWGDALAGPGYLPGPALLWLAGPRQCGSAAGDYIPGYIAVYIFLTMR